MGEQDELKRAMKDLKRGVKRAVEVPGAPSSEQDGTSVPNANVARRSNVVVSKNVGGSGSPHSAAARQTVRIRQIEGKTDEKTETAETPS